MTGILLMVSTILVYMKGIIGCSASLKDIFFSFGNVEDVLWMKNEGNLSTATESLGFNNKIETIVTVPIVSFNHLPPAGTINDGICRDMVTLT